MTWYQLSTVSHVVLLNFFQALGNVKDQVLHPWKRIVGSHPPSWRLVLTVPQPATLHSGQAASSQETWAHRLPAAQGTFPWEPFSTWSWVQTGWATVATTAVAVKRLAAKNLPSFQIHHIWFCEVSLEFFCQVLFGFFVSYSATDSCLSLPKKTNMIKKYIVHVGLAVLINPGYRSFSWSSSHFVIQYFTKHLKHHRLAICRSLHEVTVAFSGERTCHQNKLQACGCGVPFWPQELKKTTIEQGWDYQGEYCSCKQVTFNQVLDKFFCFLGLSVCFLQLQQCDLGKQWKTIKSSQQKNLHAVWKTSMHVGCCSIPIRPLLGRKAYKLLLNVHRGKVRIQHPSFQHAKPQGDKG